MIRTRQLIQESIADVIAKETGETPVETTITRTGVALVFETHDAFAAVYQWLRFGEGRKAASILETDFDEESGLRYIVINPMEQAACACVSSDARACYLSRYNILSDINQDDETCECHCHNRAEST